jgi:hypothetical protein
MGLDKDRDDKQCRKGCLDWQNSLGISPVFMVKKEWEEDHP